MPQDTTSGKAGASKAPRAPSQTIFIDSEKLGVMERLVRELPLEVTKRKRQIDFNHLEQALKTLKLIAWGDHVLSIAYGCTKSGRPGMFVGFEPHTHVIAELPEGGKNVD